MAGFHTLPVTAVDRLCDDAVAVTFAVPPELGTAYAFAPGQSVTLRRTVEGREERRSYSICAPAGSAPRVGVREVPGGLFSRWLVHEVRVGDRIEVHTPTGSFTADPAGGDRHVLIGAGSGITPLLSIAGSVLQAPASRVTLFYGNRRSATVMFAEELADLKNEHGARFELVHVLSREPREAERFNGRLDEDRIRELLALLVPVPAVDHFWLCGPFAMITAAQAALTSLGVPVEKVHRELFHVEDLPSEPVRIEDDAVDRGPAAEVTVVLDGRATTSACPRAEAILSSAQRSRPDLPFACRSGVCGTCRARVTAGEVRMVRNYALEPREVAAGFVLTCQSFPVSDEVTVDYDS